MSKVIVSLREVRGKPHREVTVSGDIHEARIVADDVHSRIKLNLVPIRSRLGLQENTRRPFWSPEINTGGSSMSFPVRCPDRIPEEEFDAVVKKSIQEGAMYHAATFLIPQTSQGVS